MATLGLVGLTLAFQTAVGSGTVGIGVIGGGSCQGDGAIAISYGLDGLDLRSVTASGFDSSCVGARYELTLTTQDGERTFSGEVTGGDVTTNIGSVGVADLTGVYLVIAD